MKVIKVIRPTVTEVTVVLSLDDIKGLHKLIGPTSIDSRQEGDKGMTKKQSYAMSEIYSELDGILEGDR